MKIKADLHNHLRTTSIFREGDFNKAVDRAARKLGENGLFAMVNFCDRRYEDFVNLRGYDRVPLGEDRNGFYVPDKKVLIVKGQEVPTKQGHMLAVGLGHNIHIKNGLSLEDTVKAIKDNRAIAIADHPFSFQGIYTNGYHYSILFESLDAMEVHNGETLPKANTHAQWCYSTAKDDNPNLGALSSSDGHSMYELGNCWTELDFDFSNIKSSDFVSGLRTAIRKSDCSNKMQMRTSYVGIIDHIADLALCSLKRKIKL